MNWSVMNMVCYEHGLLWTGLLWTWSVMNGSVMNVVCFERSVMSRSVLNGHRFSARGYCNRRLQYYGTTQFSGAEVGSENCKLGICALSSAPPLFGFLLYCHRFVQYGVRNCEISLMQLWKCFTVSPLRLACLTTMKEKGRQLQHKWNAKQGGCRVRQQ